MPIKNIKMRQGDTVEILKNGQVIMDVQIADSSRTKHVNLAFKADVDVIIQKRQGS